jgi:hypothetical protein
VKRVSVRRRHIMRGSFLGCLANELLFPKGNSELTQIALLKEHSLAHPHCSSVAQYQVLFSPWPNFQVIPCRFYSPTWGPIPLPFGVPNVILLTAPSSPDVVAFRDVAYFYLGTQHIPLEHGKQRWCFRRSGVVVQKIATLTQGVGVRVKEYVVEDSPLDQAH